MLKCNVAKKAKMIFELSGKFLIKLRFQILMSNPAS